MTGSFWVLLVDFVPLVLARKKTHFVTYFDDFVGWARQHGLHQLWLTTKGKNADTLPGITSSVPGHRLTRLAA